MILEGNTTFVLEELMKIPLVFDERNEYHSCYALVVLIHFHQTRALFFIHSSRTKVVFPIQITDQPRFLIGYLFQLGDHGKVRLRCVINPLVGSGSSPAISLCRLAVLSFCTWAPCVALFHLYCSKYSHSNLSQRFIAVLFDGLELSISAHILSITRLVFS